MGKAIHFTKQSLVTWEAWMQSGCALIIRYESLLTEPLLELERLADFLSLRAPHGVLRQIVENYHKDRLTSAEKVPGLHFNKGIAGRFKEVMNTKELSLCERHLGDYLPRMGYQ
jgi:hypothetical protein